MQKKFLFYLASFAIPLTILSISLSTQNIWWGSDTTILASDGFHQYVIFATTLRNILHGQDSLFYSFSSGLGINFYALMSYYLGSFLSPLVYFFDVQTMPDALYALTLIKVGLIGLSSFTSLSSIYKRVHPWLVLALSTSFALMSFSIGQIEINMWLDVFILVPLILLGLHRLVTKGNLWLYFTALTILFIQNYYFGFMMAIFVTLWVITYLITGVKKPVKVLINFAISSVLAGLTSSIMLLPTYLDLKTHGETLTDLSRFWTENSWYLDSFAKSMVGSYDTTKFGSIPTIYVGLFPLLLTLMFFGLKTVTWRSKLAYTFLLGCLLLSFYIEPLDLFWQGMHSPNMFLHRYSWTWSTVLIYISGQTLNTKEKLNHKQVLIPLFLLSLGFGLTAIFRSHYEFLRLEQFGLTAAFLLAYGIILTSYHQEQLDKLLYRSFTIFFVLFELGLNSYYQIKGVADEWYFPSREGYAKHLTDLDKLVKQTQNAETTFYRTERLLPQTGNDSMKYGYNGISQFSSVRNRKSSQLLDKLGFRSDGTNPNLRYQNNTIIADSLFAVTYNLHTQPISKYGFKAITTSGDVTLYRNQHALGLAMLSQAPYQDIDITVNTLDNQANLLNQLTGLNQVYFRKLTTYFPGQEAAEVLKTTAQEDGSSSLTMLVDATANSQVYLSLPRLISSNPDNEDVTLSINGRLANYTRDNAFGLLDLGYYADSQQVSVTITFPETDEVSFKRPNVYALDTLAYQAALDILKSRPVSVTQDKNQLHISYDTPTDSSLLITLPYDQGWTAQQDGQELPLKKAQNGLILLDAKAGAGPITMTFVPNGLTLGAGLSLIGLITFSGYALFQTKKHQNDLLN